MTEVDEVRFLGFAAGSEIFGAVQADFDVRRVGLAAKELSVLLNKPTAAFLAEQLGIENTPEFQQEAARDVGTAWVRFCVERGQHLDSVTVLSRSMLEGQPEFMASLRGKAGAAV